MKRLLLILAICIALNGCATFGALPVETQAVLIQSAAQTAQHALDSYLTSVRDGQAAADAAKLAQLQAALAAANQALETLRNKQK